MQSMSRHGSPAAGVSLASASWCHSTSTTSTQAIYGPLWMPSNGQDITHCFQDSSWEKTGAQPL